jgi:hypothetical protein
MASGVSTGRSDNDAFRYGHAREHELGLPDQPRSFSQADNAAACALTFTIETLRWRLEMRRPTNVKAAERE